MALSQALQGIGLEVEGLLSPAVLARAIGSAYDTGYLQIAEALAEGARRQGERAPDRPHPNRAWATSTEEGFLAYWANGWWHATFYVAEWPRAEVSSDFLAPLLLRGPRSGRCRW